MKAFFSFFKTNASTSSTNANKDNTSKKEDNGNKLVINTNNNNNTTTNTNTTKPNDNNVVLNLSNDNDIIINSNHKQVIIYQDPEKAMEKLSQAARDAEVSTVQALLGKDIFVAIETLREEREVGFYQFSRVLRRCRQEALRSIIKELMYILITQENLKAHRFEMSEYFPLTEYFKVYDSVNGKERLGELGQARQTLNQHIAKKKFPRMNMSKEAAKAFKESYREAVFAELSIQAQSDKLKGVVRLKDLSREGILNPEQEIIGGKLATIFRQLLELPVLRVGESEIEEVLDDFLLILEASKREEVESQDSAQYTQTYSRRELARQKAGLVYQDKVATSNRLDSSEENKNLLEWVNQGNQLSLMEDKKQGNLLHVLCTQSYQPGTVGESNYKQCVDYVTKACLVTGELSAIQKLLLALQEKQGGAKGYLNVALYEQVFKTLWDYYINDQYMIRLKQPSSFEEETMLHAEAWAQNKPGIWQGILNSLRDEAKCKKLLEQAQLLRGMTSFSNAIRGDEGLAAMIFYLLQDESGFDYLFHPHRHCYQAAVRYRKEAGQGIEKFGLVSEIQREVTQWKKESQEWKQQAVTQGQQLVQKDQQLVEQGQQLVEKDQKLVEQGQNLANAERKAQALERELAELRQQQVKKDENKGANEEKAKPSTGSSYYSSHP